jgi:putrescine transport system permease protein
VKQNSWFSGSVLGLGYLFLYLPIVTLVIFSFNSSQMVTIWGGFSFKWYGELLRDEEILRATWLSIKIALMTACASAILGTFAAFVLVRYKRFFARPLFNGMITAPLVMPEIVIGLSLLLFMVSLQKAIGWPERGAMTIWIGHTLVGMAYATVSIRARLQALDRSLEEAAMNLGCRPAKVFLLITLPLISQAIVSAWLLTFTLSLDDVILSAFLSGPGSTTLPLVVFSRARLGLNPEVNAIATVIIALVSIGVIAASIYLMRSQRKLEREIAEAYGDGKAAM